MFDIHQYLIPGFIGMLTGIVIVLALRKPDRHYRRRGRRRRHYEDSYNDVSPVFATLFVFLFLAGVIAMASRIQDGQGLFPDSSEQQEKNWLDKLDAEENQTQPDKRFDQDHLVAPVSAGRRINQRPSRNEREGIAIREARLMENGFSAEEHQPQAPQAQEQPAEEGWSPADGYEAPGSFYVQMGAGYNKAAALEQLKKIQRELAVDVRLGVKDEALPYKLLAGPFPDEASAREAQARLGRDKYVRNAEEEQIEVHTVD